MTPDEFVRKWRSVTANERAVAQTHFNELCALLEVPNPLDADPEGSSYAFERHVRKAAGGKGFADVWKRGAFAWEYKGKGKDLGSAYLQLLLYRDDLENPPLLIVSDIERIVVHTNFTGTTKDEHVFSLDDLLDARKRAELRKVWTEPESFNPRERREQVTEAATHEIGRIALGLRERGHDPQEVAHFLMQVVFALFAEDTGLLPNRLLTRILKRGAQPERVTAYLGELFRAMSTGGDVALEEVAHFNGGLFDGAEALPLTQAEINILYEAALLDWSDVEPAIFGTLFERSLDPAKRAQLGAHYTSREDILRIVEPVIMEPLRRRWAEIRETAEAYLADPPKNPGTATRRRREQVDAPVSELLRELQSLRVLDPACGSGNFLYVALQNLKDLEHEVVTFAELVRAPGLRLVGPSQFHGIEINPFAQELASMVIWIGYLQWNEANGVSNQQTPILEPLENIRLHDALMNEDGTEYEWPEAEYIVGNPPFLGNYKMREELGNEYVEALYSLFRRCIPNKSDLVCYWFEKARAEIHSRRAKRAGLIATNSIRGGANRSVLTRIKESGDIFLAWPDEPWILDGANVRVSVIGFDNGETKQRELAGNTVASIHADLTAGPNLGQAVRLRANSGRSFEGIKPAGPFDVPAQLAKQWAELPNKANASNADVLKEFYQGKDITDGPQCRWIIDFNQMAQPEASNYEVPFAYVSERVRPIRETNRRPSIRDRWWRFGEARPALRDAVRGLDRYLVTPRHMKNRAFVWVPSVVLPGDALTIIAAADDYTFGVLHSRIHEVWSLAQGTSLEDRPRYTPSTTFETFAFPRPGDEQQVAITDTARNLNTVREHLLATNTSLTLTKLYNELTALKVGRDATARAFPLLIAHERLDEAVAAAYGWEWPLSDDDILARLLALNLERAAAEAS